MMELKDYDRFYRADPDFFEFPERLTDTEGRLSAALREPPAGWERTDSGWWVALRPRAAETPVQGWLIHVSVALPRLPRAAEIVRGFCLLRGIAFDVVRSLTAARALGDEHADRLTSGDLMTLRPAGEAALTGALTELAVLLDGLPGPYVLGALRHRSGPLYVRYGSSGTLRCPETPAVYGAGDEPRLVPALKRPDGTLVPENRRPVFRCPDRVTLPEFLRPDLEALHAAPGEPLPWRVLRALHVTNGGGTYLADDGAGNRVVLREARPYTGLDRRGDDAVTRLGRERAVLERLAGLGRVPRVLGHHVRAGHHFLAVEHVEGRSLAEAAAAAFPLTTEERAAKEAPGYAELVLAVVDRVAGALDELHARGVRLGELNPKNVFLRPGGEVVLTDLETATDLADDRPPPLGEEGFTAPAGLRGADATAYLLDALRLWLLLPVPYRSPATLRVLTGAVEELYPLPAGFGGQLLTGLLSTSSYKEADGAEADGEAADQADHARMLAADEPDWPSLRDSLVAGIHAMATPERADRLFPCTPAGPDSLGGHAFGYGAAGVLYALHRVGAPVPDEYAAWLVASAEREGDPRPGLYDGLHGVALVLDLLGRRDEALGVLDRCRPADARVVRPDLAGGKTGIALNLLRFARVTGDTALHDAALRTAGELAALVTAGPLRGRPGVPPPYGLLHGAAGIALLFLHLYEETGAGRWLGLADRAVGYDIDRCTVQPDGALTLFDGMHHLPYLHGGSSGLAFPLQGLLRHRPDGGRAATLAAVRETCRALYVRNAGLLRGRAGAVLTLAALDGHGGRPGAAVRTQIRRLAWYAHSYRGHLAFPGFRMLRLSADLATGSAGVLLALDSAFEGESAAGREPALPYLDPRSASPRAAERR
ncbi:class III lanthionine synthetase LanKC [Streptomyces sp. NPDC008001]|uniref:class III lanthionine synthetase LanKC n=1 Tax=Streptomyces sp. NPDC008001 TaxID=3364804 RepID=UPI0036E7AEC5